MLEEREKFNEKESEFNTSFWSLSNVSLLLVGGSSAGSERTEREEAFKSIDLLGFSGGAGSLGFMTD